MTREIDQVKVVRKIIVNFDICFSTSILEDLVRTENQRLWRNLILHLKGYLRRKGGSVGFELYKFLGDGWILLFDPKPKGMEIFQFFEYLSDKFTSYYRRHIRNVLNIRIPAVGLKFGMDIGSCIQVQMNQQPEYIGRPLNVATRLQGAIRQRDKQPENKVLLSKNLYATFGDKRQIERKYKVWSVPRNLKNISEGEGFRCVKVELKRHPSD